MNKGNTSVIFYLEKKMDMDNTNHENSLKYEG